MIARLRATGEPTRLRILALLVKGDLSVSEMATILGLSQPRLSHQLKILTNAGLVTRLPEGSWVFYRTARTGPAAQLTALALAQTDLSAGAFARDARQLANLQALRARSAAAFFDSVAETWDTVRGLHFSEDAIERALLESIGEGPFRQAVDMGTGTGKMLTLLEPHVERIEGLDLSHQMLTVARDNLLRSGATRASVRHGDACAMPFSDGEVDLVVMHQLLHFVDQPDRALAEARRILAPGGRLIIVDFAPHELEFLRQDHGHRRLGIAEADLVEWAEGAGLSLTSTHQFAPPEDRANGLAVCIWRAEPAGEPAPISRDVAA